MSKRFTKIICALTASTFIIGAVAVTGCSDYYGAPKLDGDYSGEVSSNGGFAVEKGNYVYYINGVEDGAALNDFGTPVKGAIYRVAKDSLAKGDYSKVERVVPSIAYSPTIPAGCLSTATGFITARLRPQRTPTAWCRTATSI